MFETIKSFSAAVVTWLGIVLTVWFAYYTFRYQLVTSVKREQLYKVYLPMFTMIEPYLYKDVKDIGPHQLNKLLDEIEKLCKKNYELVNPRIISYVKMIRNSLIKPDHNEAELDQLYKSLCSKIDYGFEGTRKRLGLPVRNVYYKLSEKQYEDKIQLFFYFILATWKGILIIILMGIFTNWYVSRY